MPGSIRVGSLLGIPLQINVSWFIIFAIVTLSLITGQFPAIYPYWDQQTYIVVGLATSLLFFASVIAHELAHSVVARMLGVPVRSITLFVFGGVAQIARDVSVPAGELVMAAAGPMCSFVLAGIFAVAYLILRSINEPISALSGWLAWINLMLGLFNLVPGFPMDGGRMLRSLLWWATGSLRFATRVAVWAGQAIALFFAVFGIGQVITNPTSAFNGIWMAFVGWFLFQAASASSRQAGLRNALQGYTASNLMSTKLVFTPLHATLQQFADTTVAQHDRWLFVVVDRAALHGIVTLGHLGSVPKDRWPITRLATVMTPVAQLAKVHPDADASEVLEAIEDSRSREVLVVDHGELRGLITQGALYRLLQTGRARRR